MKDTGDKNGSSMKGLVLKGGKALFLRHLGGFALNFLGGIVLARVLGPEVLGLYFISYTVFVIFRQLIDFGIGVHLIRVPSDPASAQRVAYGVQQVIALAGAVLIISVLGPLAARWYGHEELFLLIVSAAIGAYFNSFQSVPVARLERELRYNKVGFIEVSELFAFNAVAVAMALAGMGLWGLVLGNILRGLVPAVIAVLLTGLRPSFSFERASVRGLLNETAPILGSNLVVWVIMLAPPLLIGSLSGSKELGIAQMAYGLLGNTVFIATIFQRISLSFLSKYQDDMVSFNKSVQHVLKLLFIFYIPLTMGVAAFSGWWVPLIYGNEWAGMFRVMAFASVPVAMAALLSVLHSALLSKGQARLIFKQNLLHAAIYWAVMLFFAAFKLGALSMPIAHIAAMFAGYMFIVGYSRHCGKLDYRPLAGGLLAAAAVMAASWFAVSSAEYLLAAVLWICFIGGFVVFSASTRETFVIFFNTLRGESK